MDAVKYLKEYVRMCSSFEYCSDCPLAGQKCLLDCCDDNIEAEKIVEIVEKWSKENPQKTILQDFLEKYPKATLHRKGCPSICTNHLGYKEQSCYDPEINYDCFNCWNRPLEG